MMTRRNRKGMGNPLGWMVIGIGALALIGLAVNGAFMSYLWPLFVILPGVGLFSAVKQGGRSWAWLTVPATFITASGLLLLFGAITDLWASFAYLGWLVFPGSIGLGLAVYGDITRKLGAARAGEIIGKIGVGMALVFGIILELVFNLNGFAGGITGLILAGLVMLAGVFLLFMPNRNKSKRYTPTSSLPSVRRELLDESVLDDDPLFRETPVRRAERR